MLFNSLPFLLLFLPISLGGYYLAGALRPIAAAAWLCIASLVFYSWWNPVFVTLLLGSIAFNYVVSLGILSTENRPRLQSWLLAGGIVANLGLLFYYKYLVALLDFLAGFGLVSHSVSEMILPLGISFFTFTQLGFLLDCRAGVVRERSFVSYVLFVTFFPHLIAGPILHHKEMMPQFADRESYRFKAENLSIGATLFIIGLAKKVLLADSIAPWAEAGFNAPGELQFMAAWGTALAYALQLYFDFSGYSDMAMGLAKMFGIRFPLNFNSPYKSTGIIEFWTRFHMTLTRYLTAYLYNPVAMTITRARARKGLSVGRKATATARGFGSMILFPTVFTMGLAGIWHGAGLQFLIFGLLHGVYLSVNHAWRLFGPNRTQPATGWRRAAYVVLTFLCVVFALLFFRAHSTHDAFTLIGSMLGLKGLESLAPMLYPLQALTHADPSWTAGDLMRLFVERWSQGLLILGMLVVVWCAPNSNQIMNVYSPALEGPAPGAPRWLQWRPTLAWTVLSMGVLAYAALNLHKTARFLYFQF
ncbi:membrane bound O-acyl transferase MBOAT family protein [Pandoraea capi]|uniref:Probable alginate O-acetylase AlgI n=1 Tax=Pandoraea capi TaxID=2508286 RepID=A0ABY6W510_9BURK|nr:MBOAT family O-acyltransferase [Pandoraea capi]VVE27460.1 membrane bound O-acyl transferase MBOAT family protein [Pandoraea capi]